MKECKQVKEQLSAYIDDMLNDDEKSAVSCHLAECQDCLGEYEFLKGITAVAKSLPERSVSKELHESICKRLEEEASKPQKTRFSLWKNASKVVAAAAVIAISIVSLNSLPEHPELTTDDVTSQATQTATPALDTSQDIDIENNTAQPSLPRTTPQATIAPETEAGAAAKSTNQAEEKQADSQKDLSANAKSANQAEEKQPEDQEDALAEAETAALDIVHYSAGRAKVTAGGGGLQTTVEYSLTEDGMNKAELLLTDFKTEGDAYLVPQTQFETLNQQLTALSGYLNHTISEAEPLTETVQIILIQKS